MLKRIIASFCVLLTLTVLSPTCLPCVLAVNTNHQIEDGAVLLLPSVEETQVLNNNSVKSASKSITYNYVGKKRYWGIIRYYDYLCYKNPLDWGLMTGLNLTDAIFHSKNSGKKTLAFTKSVTYTSQTAGSFSIGAGAEAGVGDMVKASASLGVGITKTISRSYQASSTIQAEIPASANTGYYKMHVCYNFYRTKIIQQRTNGTHQVTNYISMPFSESYAAVVYSSTAGSGTWSIWL